MDVRKENSVRGEDRTGRHGPVEAQPAHTRQPQGATDPLVRFVRTKGPPVTGRHRDKSERIAETVSDLEVACEEAFSLARRTERGHQARWVADLARACSFFLRKMVIGDRNDPATRLLDAPVVRMFGLGFAKLRPIPPPERRTMEVGMSMPGGVMRIQKLNEATGNPEATEWWPMAPHTLRIAIEWPLPGAASWTSTPTEGQPWMLAPEELFTLDSQADLDCNRWLGQQLVMFDDHGITLKDVIRTVVTYEGAHAINASRLLKTESERFKGPCCDPEWHILDNITVFGMKYTHIVVIECALYLYEMLMDRGHVARLGDEEWRLRPSFVTLDADGFFSARQDWLVFAGGLIPAMGTAERKTTHRIRAVR